MRWNTQGPGIGKLWQGRTVLSVAVLVTLLLFFWHLWSRPSTLKVTTYLNSFAQVGVDHRPLVDEGDPVCLNGVVEAIGRVESVRAKKAPATDGWKVVMSLDKPYQSMIPADSVVLLRMGGPDRRYCRASGAQVGVFLEIDTTVRGRCFDTLGCNPLKTALEDDATLKASYRLFCGEEGVGCGGVAILFPKTWWQKGLDSLVEFVVMDIGVIYIELGSAVVTVIAGLALLIIFVRRRLRNRARRPCAP